MYSDLYVSWIQVVVRFPVIGLETPGFLAPRQRSGPVQPGRKKSAVNWDQRAMARQGHGDSGDNVCFVLGFYEMKLDRKSPAAKGKHFTGSLGGHDFLETFFLQGWP